MSTTRREFILTTTAAAAGAALLPRVLHAEKAAKPLRILILGGTGFLGPACTESALARGHAVTHFNSGRSEERRHEAGRPSVVPAGVEQLYGNRDPNKTAADRKAESRPGGSPSTPPVVGTGPAPAPAKDPNSPKGLSQLVGKKWDAVIDTSGFFPRMVKASAELLAPNVRQYVFISTISVYKDTRTPNFDENSPLATLADPTVEDFGKDFSNYGGGKAACEKAAEAAMPGRVTSVRAGFIVGPRDTSGRFIYWPVRASLGGAMIVPGRPTDPIQIIDVRDLADWIIHCIENNVVGVYNATGPDKEQSMKAFVEGVSKGVGTKPTFTWIDDAFLKAQNVGENQFPLYAPPSGDTAGFHRCNIQRALAKGLKFRPLPDTSKVTLDWYKSLPPDLQGRIAPQFAKPANEEAWLDKEKRVLAAWQSSQKK
ncbi:MAG TPA: epimerase [Polyangia bacterium]|jgi:2'-hydroxyisoflavone reductase|nr:epimerase [Polyangia bacterium]